MNKKKQFSVEILPEGALPIYSCELEASPMICRIKSRKDGSVESKMVKVRKGAYPNSCSRYAIPLYKINGDNLLGISNIIRGMEKNKENMSDVILCISRKNEIGLGKHDNAH